jgi:dihydrofolate reductase
MTMHKLTLSIAASLDGYIARRDGRIDWLAAGPDDDDQPGAALVARADTIVMGRRTWDLACERDGPQPFGGRRCVVFSRRRAGQRQGRAQFTDEDPETCVRRLRQTGAQRGSGIWLVGGGEIVRLCLEAGIVNEVMLTLVPVLLGDGVPLFLPRAGTTWLKLLDARAGSDGRVLLRYAPAGFSPRREAVLEAAAAGELLAV